MSLERQKFVTRCSSKSNGIDFGQQRFSLFRTVVVVRGLLIQRQLELVENFGPFDDVSRKGYSDLIGDVHDVTCHEQFKKIILERNANNHVLCLFRKYRLKVCIIWLTGFNAQSWIHDCGKHQFFTVASMNPVSDGEANTTVKIGWVSVQQSIFIYFLTFTYAAWQEQKPTNNRKSWNKAR